jgi:hypothetical protein
MIRIDVVLALARAEARLTRRLVRYWLFLILAAGLGLLALTYYSVIHYFVSGHSATIALINPRYIIAFLGIYFMALFMIGLIFLGFDVRARDARERIVEVVDALPCTNLELLLGKFLGILFMVWLPVPFICGLAALIGLPFGELLELNSVLMFIFITSLPTFSFVLGLTFLCTLLVRHRGLATIVLLGLVIGLIVINGGFVPIYLLPLTDLTGAYSLPPASDILPAFIERTSLVQRLGYMLAGIGMVWLAAAVYPRRDDQKRGSLAGVGAAMVLVGVLLCVSLVMENRGLINERDGWKQAHSEAREVPAPDLMALSGLVSIDPGHELDMELQLEFRAPQGATLASALFSLNPGLDVQSVSGPDGQALSFSHENGLLDIGLPGRLGPGQTSTVMLRITGRPNNNFAYLDSIFNPLELDISEASVTILGFINLFFEQRFVALLPEVRWLPASGAEVGRGDPTLRPRDYFTLDLTVELPGEWLAAGPGRRLDVPEAAAEGRVRYRYAPPAPVPDVALIAGELTSRSVEVKGVMLEVLVAPAHAGSLDIFADATVEIEDWLAERLLEAEEIGLAYPYDGLTLVEVPNGLRGYGGGWRMDTTFAQPGMILMRETSFPTARFDILFKDPEKFRDEEGGLPQAKLDALSKFFETDFSGGNPFLGASRNFFSYQTAGAGPEGMALDFVWEDLSNRLVSGKQGYFSAHHYGSDLGEVVGKAITSYFSDTNANVADTVIHAIVARAEVWDALLGVSLADLDPWSDPKGSLDVLVLKGGAMTRSLVDTLGRSKAGELLSKLREMRSGGSYTREDVVAVGHEIGVDLEEWVRLWIDQTELPGFVLEQSTLERITDSEEGAPLYQSQLVLRNAEPVPGFFKVDYRTGDPKEELWDATDTIRLAGNATIEIGIVTSSPPTAMRVAPYLSLNREAFSVDVPNVDETKIVSAEPFDGVRDYASNQAADSAIVVDDLDDGFRIDDQAKPSFLRRFGKRDEDEVTDGGLPVFTPNQWDSRWLRADRPKAWGKYRHTIARVKAGEGDRRAIFNVDLPRSGQWQVEYYLPTAGNSGRGRSYGTWQMTLIDPSGDQTITFDAVGGEAGWNSLGTFELAGGEVTLEVSNETDGKVVIADAVRFKPAGGSAATGAGI